MNSQISLRLSNSAAFYVKNFLETQSIAELCKCRSDCRCQNLIVIAETSYLSGFGLDHKNTIVLTSTLEEEVECYTTGIAICHRKPINFRLLRAQVTALMKDGDKSFLSFGNLRLDESTKSVYQNKIEVSLTRSEYNLLSILVRKKGTILSKSEVCTKIIDGSVMSYRALDTLVSRLRKKVNDIEIETIYGMGIRLKE